LLGLLAGAISGNGHDSSLKITRDEKQGRKGVRRMSFGWAEQLGSLGIVVLTALLCSVIHYNFLKRLNDGFRLTIEYPRIRLLLGVIVALIAHSIEVALFALAYALSIHAGHGQLVGSFDGTIGDYLYFSYAAFTTVGFGDVVATGLIRLLAGVEALTGFVLITWTASYLYLEMTRLWQIKS